ncbi:MAG: hypothetical protein IH845_01060 [Nanoarchaeota archaeon]|nr:hypothetical protein [Nanoarchaeota archaeon]
MKDFEGVAAIMIFSKNIIKSTKWYSKLIKTKPIFLDKEKSMIKIGKIKLVFHLPDKKSPVSTGGQVCYWKVNNFDNFIKRAIKLGAKIHRGPIEVENSNYKICQLKDPFGSVFGIEGKLFNNHIKS